MGFAVSVVLLTTIIAVTSFFGIRRLSIASKSLERSHLIVHKEADILREVAGATGSVHDYLVTGKPELLGPYRVAKRKILKELEAFRRGSGLNDQETESLEETRAKIEEAGGAVEELPWEIHRGRRIPPDSA